MAPKAKIQQFGDNLYLITLPVAIEGFEGFIGSWVHTGNPMILVDVGPSATVPHLIAALSELDAGKPDIILLTHIHIDHAGGAGALACAYPDTLVVCHPKGVQHLITPDRLWQGSLKTLGETARAYGPIPPLPAGQAATPDQLPSGILTCLETPGHAAHHLSFLIGDLLFAGEAGGVNLPMVDDGIYLRPATPPRFFLETSIASIDRVLAEKPGRLCYGHIGMGHDAVELLRSHRDQLQRWQDMIQPFFEQSRGELDIEVMSACRDYLLAHDPLLAAFGHLPHEVQNRERFFMINALKGYWGYLTDKGRQRAPVRDLG